MNLECCVCGEEVWNKLGEAIDNELKRMDEVMPVIGIVCDACLNDLREKGILK